MRPRVGTSAVPREGSDALRGPFFLPLGLAQVLAPPLGPSTAHEQSAPLASGGICPREGPSACAEGEFLRSAANPTRYSAPLTILTFPL